MSLMLTQVAVTSSATELATVNPYDTVTLLASAATTIGTSPDVTSSTGFALPASVPVPFTVPGFATQGPVTLYGITASTANVSIIQAGA
jgi:hypothetical protein